MFKICHLTTAHDREDVRIFYKMCTSLSREGFETSLIVVDGRGDEIRNNVQIYDEGRCKNRRDRILNAPSRVYKRAIRLDCELYHLHDPELIPIGLKLKRAGRKVLFDSHEDVPKQLLGKPYLTPVLLRFLSACYAKFERYACARFDAVITATPYIRDRFRKINPVTVDIKNFPIIGELAAPPNHMKKRSTVCYVGGITAVRGIREMAQAMELLKSDIRLEIAGRFSPPELANECRHHLGWIKIDELGFIDRMAVRDLYSRSLAGLVTLQPTINYVEALPVKMFEYMSAGIPVIASDFPLWRKIVEGHDCGICVDPLSPHAIAAAIQSIAEDPVRGYEMGQNGKRAVQELYNWKIEEQKLIQLYNKLLQGTQ